MKRKFAFCAFVILSIFMFADSNIAFNRFNEVKSLYYEGKYEDARQGFQECINKYHNDPIFIENCREYVRLCKKQLSRINQLQAEQKRAAQRAAEQERMAREEKKRRRLEDNRVFISADAYIFDKEYIYITSAVKRELSKAGYSFTNNSEEARWAVIISAVANKFNFSEEPVYYSTVAAWFSLVDLVNHKTVYEDVINGHTPTPYNIGNSPYSYEAAANDAYTKISKKIGELLVTEIKTK